MPLTAPTRIGHILPNPDSVRIYWAHDGSAVSFEIQRSLDAVAWSTIGTAGAAYRQFIDTTPTGAVYYYRVLAIDDNTFCPSIIREVNREAFFSPDYVLAEWVYDFFCNNSHYYGYQIEFPSPRELLNFKIDEWHEQFQNVNFPYIGFYSYLKESIPGGTSQAQTQGGRDFYWGVIHLTTIFESKSLDAVKQQASRFLSDFTQDWECNFKYGGEVAGRIPDEVYISKPQINTVFWDNFEHVRPLHHKRKGNETWLLRQDIRIHHHFFVNRFECHLPTVRVITTTGVDPVPNIACHWVKLIDSGKYEIVKSLTTDGNGEGLFTLTLPELLELVGGTYTIVASIDVLNDPAFVDEVTERIGTLTPEFPLYSREDDYIAVIYFPTVNLVTSQPASNGEALLVSAQPISTGGAQVITSQPTNGGAKIITSQPDMFGEVTITTQEDV